MGTSSLERLVTRLGMARSGHADATGHTFREDADADETRVTTRHPEHRGSTGRTPSEAVPMFLSLTLTATLTAAAAHVPVVSALSPQGRADRRLRRVAAQPEIATADDVELLVRAHGVREDKVWAVVDRVAAAAIAPAQAWVWVMAFDGTELADLCRSDLTDDEVRQAVAEVRAFDRTHVLVA